jgi:hypothetical protein
MNPRSFAAPRAWAVWKFDRLPRLTLLLLALTIGSGLSGCAKETPGGLRNIEADRFRIQDPGGPHSAATGTGCGETEKEAVSTARSTAQYNLRTMLGAGTYKVDFTIPREVPGQGRYCVEVEARAVR